MGHVQDPENYNFNSLRLQSRPASVATRFTPHGHQGKPLLGVVQEEVACQHQQFLPTIGVPAVVAMHPQRVSLAWRGKLRPWYLAGGLTAKVCPELLQGVFRAKFLQSAHRVQGMHQFMRKDDGHWPAADKQNPVDTHIYIYDMYMYT